MRLLRIKSALNLPAGAKEICGNLAFVLVIDDAAGNHVRKSENLILNLDVARLEIKLIEQLPVKFHDLSVGMHGTAMNISDLKEPASVGYFYGGVILPLFGENLYAKIMLFVEIMRIFIVNDALAVKNHGTGAWLCGIVLQC